jgi:sugar phosphate isomerase/epimerase
MSLDEVLEFCADLGFDAVDPTGYYFPGYPEVAEDSYLYRIKRKAFRLGLDISGTGVRNDFTLADDVKRKAEVELVKRWVDFSAKFGAPALRVFSGRGVPEGKTRAEVNTWLAQALRECVEYSSAHGVMIVLQNHADFIETSDHVLQALKDVNSEWLAVNLDIGSFRTRDPYAEIARIAPYAATWQIKENLYVDGKEEKTDLDRIVRIVRESGYRGYLPLETLGAGDPKVKVPKFLDQVRASLARH